jgi:DNA-binding IclR family transcriptional regulator
MSRSLVYGLGLLKLFTAEEPVRGIAELADLMAVSRPTAHRYASTCLELGYLEQAPMRRYRLARRAAEPGMAMLDSLVLTQRSRPILQELREETGRTVSLAVLDGEEVLYLQRLCGFERGSYELEEGLGSGSRRPARRTAAGKALLSTLGEGEHEEQRWIHQSGLAVDACERGGDVRERTLDTRKGRPHARARGLAIAVEVEVERTSAIEITVPAETMSAAETVASLGEELRAAGAALRAALSEGSAGTPIISEGIAGPAN